MQVQTGDRGSGTGGIPKIMGGKGGSLPVSETASAKGTSLTLLLKNLQGELLGTPV